MRLCFLGFVVFLKPVRLQLGDDGTLAIHHSIRLRPEAVADIEFLEWTEADRLRHSKFVRLRDDTDPRQVVKEHSDEKR